MKTFGALTREYALPSMSIALLLSLTVTVSKARVTMNEQTWIYLSVAHFSRRNEAISIFRMSLI